MKPIQPTTTPIKVERHKGNQSENLAQLSIHSKFKASTAPSAPTISPLRSPIQISTLTPPPQQPQPPSWLRCVAVVCFDIDAGQVTEFCMPNNALTMEEKKRIAYLSLPDSYNADQDRDGSNVDFTFRTRRDTDIPLVPEIGSQAPPHSYDYGYVYFRRSRDPSVRRGYVQKAVRLKLLNSICVTICLFSFTCVH